MKEYRVKPDSKLNLDKYDPSDTGEYEKTNQGKEQVKTITAELTAKLDRLQERLYANADRSLLIVLQGMDTSGKDGTIKHVMSGVNPQGCRVATFKTPPTANSPTTFFGASITKCRPKDTSASSTGPIMKMCSLRGSTG